MERKALARRVGRDVLATQAAAPGRRLQERTKRSFGDCPVATYSSGAGTEVGAARRAAVVSAVRATAGASPRRAMSGITRRERVEAFAAERLPGRGVSARMPLALAR